MKKNKNQVIELSEMLYCVYKEFDGKPDDLILKLFKDAFMQYSKKDNIYDDAYLGSLNYKEYMKENNALIFDVNCYCKVYNKINDNYDKFVLDYYSDLYLFECLNKLIKKTNT